MAISYVAQMVLCSVIGVLNNLLHSCVIKITRKTSVKLALLQYGKYDNSVNCDK
jgi:hypothetical protein